LCLDLALEQLLLPLSYVAIGVVAIMKLSPITVTGIVIQR